MLPLNGYGTLDAFIGQGYGYKYRTSKCNIGLVDKVIISSKSYDIRIPFFLV